MDRVTVALLALDQQRLPREVLAAPLRLAQGNRPAHHASMTPFELAPAAFEITRQQEGHREVVVGIHIIGLEYYGVPKTCQRRRRVALRQHRAAKVVVSLGRAWRKRKRSPMAFNRAVALV